MAPVEDFETFYHSSFPVVLAAASAVAASNSGIAEDATNDAFIQAYRKWPRVAAMSSPVGWTVRTAIRRVRRLHRLANRRQERERALMSDPTVGHQTLTDSVMDEEVWAAVAALSPRQRQAVVLRYVEDLTQKQAACEMDIAPGSMAATLNHARGQLKRRLGTPNATD